MTTKRTDVERDLEAQATDEQRQRSGSTPTEDVVERALDVEPGVSSTPARTPVRSRRWTRTSTSSAPTAGWTRLQREAAERGI